MKHCSVNISYAGRIGYVLQFNVSLIFLVDFTRELHCRCHLRWIICLPFPLSGKAKRCAESPKWTNMLRKWTTHKINTQTQKYIQMMASALLDLTLMLTYSVSVTLVSLFCLQIITCVHTHVLSMNIASLSPDSWSAVAVCLSLFVGLYFVSLNQHY